MELQDKIKNWLAKDGAFTADDRKQIKAEALKAELDVKFAGKCQSCYRDAVVLLALRYKVGATSEGVATKSGKYVFSGKVPVRWWHKGMTYTMSQQSSDALIELYMRENPRQTIYREKGGEQ